MKIRNKNITKNIWVSLGPENMFYLVPTLCFHKLDLSHKEYLPTTIKPYINYLIAIKWLKGSIGINFKRHIKPKQR